MKRSGLALFVVTAALLTAAQALSQETGQGRAVITVFAKHTEVAPAVSQQDVSAKVNGKDASVTNWAQFKGADNGLELVLLIDAGARNLGRQLDEISHFIQGLGPQTRIAVGYMQNGRAVLTGPLSVNHKQVASELHLPAGPTTNPYFSLSDLARNWPSQDNKARREVVLFSDGIDPENRRFDADDPYVEAAIHDSVRAGLVVFTIYWQSWTDRQDSSITVDGGQSLLNELTQATGGYNYWSGAGNPVSFQPFFEELTRRLENQYSLDVAAHMDRKPEVETLKLKVEGLGLQVTAPQQVFVHSGGAE